VDPRSRPLAPLLGIVLILLGLACFSFLVWANAPMEEPASPGTTPNPSRKRSAWDEWLDRRWVWMIRFLKYGAIPGGLVSVVAGVLLLIPEKAKRE
jgi:hypothetical protein